MFLARYYMKRTNYREAEAHAHKSTEFVAVSTVELSTSWDRGSLYWEGSMHN